MGETSATITRLRRLATLTTLALLLLAAAPGTASVAAQTQSDAAEDDDARDGDGDVVDDGDEDVAAGDNSDESANDNTNDDGTIVRNTGAPYAVASLLLGIAGTEERAAADFERNLTFGILGRYMWPVHKHVALGAQLGLRSWQGDWGDSRAADRNTLIELVFVPMATYPATREIEVHAILPIGPAINFPGSGDFASDVGAGIGFTVGFFGGARFFLDPAFGLLLELGYVSHQVSHTIDGPPETEIDIHVDELSLNVGLFF